MNPKQGICPPNMPSVLADILRKAILPARLYVSLLSR